MSFVKPHRVDDKVVPNFYEKIRTQGDSSEFSTEAPGRRAVLPWSDGTYNDMTGAWEYELPFSYLVNQKQLHVYWCIDEYTVSPPRNRGWALLLDLETAEENPSFNILGHPYYVELAADKVAIYNVDKLYPTPYVGTGSSPSPGPGSNNTFLFAVPHTALPGSVRNRLIVEDQGDNVGLEMQGPGDGIVLKSPQGKPFLIRVNEGGMLTTEEL